MRAVGLHRCTFLTQGQVTVREGDCLAIAEQSSTLLPWTLATHGQPLLAFTRLAQVDTMQCLSFPVSPSLHSDSSTALSSSLILPHKSLTPGETASSILSIILRAPIVIRHVETVRRHARAAANSPGEREAQLTKGTWIRRGYAKTPAAPAAEPYRQLSASRRPQQGASPSVSYSSRVEHHRKRH